jgi:F0F1-type ATP synthase membrane subunit b/b'
MSSVFVFAVSTGVVVIVVAIAVVLVVLLVTLSMRGRQKRAAQRVDDARRDVDEAEARAAQTERDRDIAREGGADLDPRSET